MLWYGRVLISTFGLNNTQNAIINKNMTTYRDLYNTALTEIKSVCQNVSNYGNVPRSVKTGYTLTKSVTGRDLTYGGEHWTDEGKSHLKRISAGFSIKNPITQVSESIVDEQFEDYMDSCGFKPLILDSTTTPRGELLFMMAVAEFVTAKIYTVQGQGSSKLPCYNTTTTPTVVYYNNEPIIKKEDTNINDAILKNTAQVKVNYTHGFV